MCSFKVHYTVYINPTPPAADSNKNPSSGLKAVISEEDFYCETIAALSCGKLISCPALSLAHTVVLKLRRKKQVILNGCDGNYAVVLSSFNFSK